MNPERKKVFLSLGEAYAASLRYGDRSAYAYDCVRGIADGVGMPPPKQWMKLSRNKASAIMEGREAEVIKSKVLKIMWKAMEEETK